ncbi:MAG: nitrate reductase cytochrome c-type subunit, partial [Azovibrio sp.]|nr:nitrate reductase cytochrome c-type subunit [Azovibrio sp.]
MKSRFLPAALLASLMLVSLPGFASGDGLNTLRGAPIQGSETESNDAFKMSKESAPIPRDYVQQPPL